jgi:hypothetical protein
MRNGTRHDFFLPLFGYIRMCGTFFASTAGAFMCYGILLKMDSTPVLGEDLNALLGEIAQYLSTLNTAFSSATDSLAVPIVSLLSVAAPASLALSQRLQAVVNGKNLLSNKVKVSK